MANETTAPVARSWAHLSLFYLAGYAGPSGLSLLFAPQLTTHLLFSNGHYPDVIVRMVGVPLAALGLFVVQVVRLKLTQLHTTTLAARVFIVGSLVGLYLESGDPMFAVLVGIVGFGFLLTLTGVLLDRRAAARA